MQLSRVPLIGPRTPASTPAPGLPPARALTAVPSAPGAALTSAFAAPSPGAPQLVPPKPQGDRKPRGGETADGRIWIANQTALNQVLLARLDLANASFPALLLQLPNERKPVRLTISPATASRCAAGQTQGAEATVALHPVGCSSTRRSWYFRAAPAASVAPSPATRAQAGFPFVVLHGGQDAREALYLARRFDAEFNDAGFTLHLADLPANAQAAGPTPARVTSVQLDPALKVVDVQQADATILCQGAVSHGDLAAFFLAKMEGPFIELPYAASMALVRLIGSQLASSKSVAKWHEALVQLVRHAAQEREVAHA